MLPIVDAFTRLRVRERRRPAAENRLLLEHGHARAARGQIDSGAQPGDAGAYDNDVG